MRTMFWICVVLATVQALLVIQTFVGVYCFGWHRTSEEWGLVCLLIVECLCFIAGAFATKPDKEES